MEYFRIEKEFRKWVCQLATRHGWRYHFVIDSRWGPKGFPDLVLCKAPNKLLIAELKMPGKVATDLQLLWLGVFEAVGVPAYLWYPEDQRFIRRLLRGSFS